MPHRMLANHINSPAPSLAERLTGHVQSRLHGCVRDFCVRLQSGYVVLTGRTHTYYAKQLAQQYVKEMTDLPVANEIEVADGMAPRSERANT